MMPKGADDPVRQLNIKPGACRRMIKEAAYYKKEAGQNEARVQKMKDDGIDPWTVKKAEEVLGESYMMIPDSEKRMKESIEDLFTFLVRARARARVCVGVLVGVLSRARASNSLSDRPSLARPAARIRGRREGG